MPRFSPRPQRVILAGHSTVTGLRLPGWRSSETRSTMCLGLLADSRGPLAPADRSHLHRPPSSIPASRPAVPSYLPAPRWSVMVGGGRFRGSRRPPRPARHRGPARPAPASWTKTSECLGCNRAENNDRTGSASRGLPAPQAGRPL